MTEDDIQLELIINARYDRWCLGFLLKGTKSTELPDDVVVKKLAWLWHILSTFHQSLKVKSLHSRSLSLPDFRMTSKAFINFQQIFFYLLRIRIYSRMKFIVAEWSGDMRDGRFERANSSDPSEAFTVNEIEGSSEAGGRFNSHDSELTFIKLKNFWDFQLLALVIWSDTSSCKRTFFAFPNISSFIIACRFPPQ